MPKTIQISAAARNKFCFNFGVQNDPKTVWVFCIKVWVFWIQAWASLRRSKKIPRWPEKLPNGSKTGLISFQEAPGGVQSLAKLPPRRSHWLPRGSKKRPKAAKLPPRSCCDDDREASMQKSQVTVHNSHFTLNNFHSYFTFSQIHNL